MARLLGEAHRKFQAGFAASQNNDSTASHQRPRNNDDKEDGRHPIVSASPFAAKKFGPPLRCNSVLGIRSSEREVDGALRRTDSPSGGKNLKLTLDYVDLECLLQEKMRELNVQMPKFQSSRGKHLGEDSSASRCVSTGRGEGNDAEFAVRVKEAAFLFRLCQQEIKLQVNISCPERSRLIERSLEFWSGVLDCLVTPFDHTRAQVTALRQQIARDTAMLNALCADMCAWSKESSHLLESSVWRQVAETEAQLAASLRDQLRDLTLRSCYASSSFAARSKKKNGGGNTTGLASTSSTSSRALSPSPPHSPSPPLLSRASTSRASSRASSRSSTSCKKDQDHEQHQPSAEREGASAWGEGEDGIEGSSLDVLQDVPLVLKDVRMVLKLTMACLSAACRALVQLHDDKHELQEQLEAHHKGAMQQMALTLNSHAAEVQRMQAELEQEKQARTQERTSAEVALGAAQSSLAAAETGNTKVQQQLTTLQHTVAEMKADAAAEAAANASRVQGLEEEVAAARATITCLQSQLSEHEHLAADERACSQQKLTATRALLDQVSAELFRFTQDGIVLTPRPDWAPLSHHPGGEETATSSAQRAAHLVIAKAEGEHKIGALEQQLASLTTAFELAKEAAERESVVRKTAEDVSEKLSAQLQTIRDRPLAHASCCCPEPTEDKQLVMVELREYLAVYLNKRFGLQGHMASWEVEKMSKDLGWLMALPVRSAVQS